MSLVLTGLAVGSGLLQFGGGLMQAQGTRRQAEEQRRRAERAIRFARSDARADLRMATAELDAEETNMRMQATLQSQQLDLQQQGLRDEAVEHAGMSLVSDAMRGVTGSGTQRSMMRGFRERGQAQRGLGLERTAAFSQQRRAETMLGIQRERTREQFGRVMRDTMAMERDIKHDVRQEYRKANAQAWSGFVSGGMTAGYMLYRGGAFTRPEAAQFSAEETTNVMDMERRFSFQ